MKNLYKSLVVAISMFAFVQPAFAERIVLLHTNDTHSQIDPADDGLGGVARRKVVIDSVRRVQPNVMLIDAGDVVQGTLFFNIYKGEVEEKLMNALGYDLRILGNHEFDNGMDMLADNLKQSQATLLASNYGMRGTPLEGLFKPYYINEIDGHRIGFIPVNLNPDGMISAPNYSGMTYVNAIDAANNLAWMLKNIEQVDMVVAITHIGYLPSEPPGDVSLVESSKDIDLVIGGHSHTIINPSDTIGVPYIIKNADGRGVIVAQTGKGGRYVGQIDIELDSIGIDGYLPQYKLITIDQHLDKDVDGSIEEIIAPYRAEIAALGDKKVGRTARQLNIESNELLNWATDVVCARGRQIADNVEFGILNKGGLRRSLPKGDITEGDIIMMMPFFNRVEVIDIKGADLLEAFNQMAKVDGNGVSSEVEIIYDPDTDKCTDVKINGKPLEADNTYRVATIDYLAMGGDYMPTLTHHDDVASSRTLLYEDVIDYLKTGAGHGKKINPNGNARMKPIK